MSDFNSHSTQDEDPQRHRGLPTPRPEGGPPKPLPDEPAAQISLEEMMERLQRSGKISSGTSAPGSSAPSSSGSGGESRSGRRRRSSSSSSSSSSNPDSASSAGSTASSSSRSSASAGGSRSRGSSHSDRPASDPASSPYRAEDENSLRSRTVLPAPRRPLNPTEEREDFPKTPRVAIASQGKKSKAWLYLLITLALLGLGGWIGVRQLNRVRIEGEGFRVNAARRISELIGRPLSIARFRQSGPDELTTASFKLTPNHRDLLENFDVSTLNLRFAPGSWLADDWAIRDLRINQANLSFQPAKPMDQKSMWEAAPAPFDRGASNQGFRLSMTSDPASVLVETGRFEELNFTWPGPTGKPESLTKLQGNFNVSGPTLTMEIAGGLLDTAAWPAFALRQANARLTGTKLEIVSARLGFTPDHDVRLTGTADLVPDGKIDLKADISPVLLKHFLPTAWANTVMGSFEAPEAAWLSHFKDGPPATLSGPFRVKGLVLRTLPFVDKIATILRNPTLALMEFPVLTGKFAWTPGGTYLTDLSAVSKDELLRLKGRVTSQPGENLSGTLTVEARDTLFIGLPPGSESFFTPSGEEGWRSLTFNIGGSENAITDTIEIANPSVIRSRPASATHSFDEPRMSLPPGTPLPKSALPAPAPSAAANPVPVPAVPAATPPTPRPAPRPATAPAAPRPPSDAELERSFNDILGR
ncbi:MAG: hypothetical protein JWL81_3052 [Verrucomicrobiales bacterium]|nr:hypothetical protein [Verrucomicrobiales bacterium]